MILLFLKGALLGLAIAAPLGPIGALCINRTLARGFWAGLAGGLGTALADGVYASLAALGFATFGSVLQAADLPLRLGGGLFLLWLGAMSLRPAAQRPAASTGARDLIGTIAATFLLTIANPVTILSFAAIFAGLGLGNEGGAAAMTVTAGVFCGSLLWWAILSGGVTMLRDRLPAGFAIWVARASGVVLTGFGLWSLASLL